MVADVVQENGRRDLLDARDVGDLRRAKPGLRAAYRLSGAIAVLMVIASAAGLLVDGLYRDGPWAREALRGGDLTTMAVAVPILVTSLLLARRGSRAAQAVWLGALAYSLYNYAYYVFGAAFNDIFVSTHRPVLALDRRTRVGGREHRRRARSPPASAA